jgi:undecaprenol kinase
MPQRRVIPRSCRAAGGRPASGNGFLFGTTVVPSPLAHGCAGLVHLRIIVASTMSTAKNQPFLVRFRFARAGLAHALATEHSLRFQLAVFGAVLVALAVLRPEPLWWALVLLASGAVITAELFNTAIELLADHLHPETHASIRIVKDCAAGAVLVSSIIAIAVGVALGVHLCLTRW